jgi:hypothetical protein
MPGGNFLRKAARVTTGTAVAATEVMVMSFEMTGRIVKRLLPRGRGGND